MILKTKNLTINALLKQDGTIVVLIPFLGSLVSLAFEAGYLSFYDVPVTLIQLDFVKIITATLVVIVYAFLFTILAAVVLSIVKKGEPLGMALADSAAAFLLFAPFLIVTSGNKNAWIALGLLCLLLALSNLLPPLMQWRTGLRYKQRLTNYLEQEKEKLIKEEESLLERFILQPIALMGFLLLIVFLIGRQHAEVQIQYYVMKDEPNWVLLASYGDSFIFKNVNWKNKQIGTNMRLLKITDSETLNLDRVVKGKLNPLDQEEYGNP